MPFREWKEKDWNALIHSIRQGNCILMLGPDTAIEEVNEHPRPLAEILANQLAEDIDKSIREKINTSNLAEVSQYYSMEMGRNDLEVMVQSFYEKRQLMSSQFHKDLAALPFYFVITTSPDNMFYEALKQENKEPVKERYHFKGKNPYITEIGNAEKPLLFYLNGTIDEPNSLVLTENDLLDFLVAINSKKPLPDRIVSELQTSDKSFLFLGFGFRHWYLRIFLHVLEIKRKASRSFALEEFTPQNVDELESTALFFQKSICKIHIFKKYLNEFAMELRKRYLESAETSCTTPQYEYQNRPKVFICHANEDKNYAELLYKRLHNSGFELWLDKETLRGGDQWDLVIKKAIKKEIDYFLILQSQILAKKLVGYVNKEILEARERQKEFRFGIRFIIPVKIDDCPFLEVLEDLQTIDLTDENGFERLVQAIKRDFKKRGN